MRWRTVFGASVITGALGILLVAQLSSGTEGEPAPPRQPPLEGTSLVVAPHCAPPGRERTVTFVNHGPNEFTWGMWTGRIEQGGRTTHLASFEPGLLGLRLMKTEDVPDDFAVLSIGYMAIRDQPRTWRFTPPSTGDSTLILGDSLSIYGGARGHDIVTPFRTSHSC